MTTIHYTPKINLNDPVEETHIKLREGCRGCDTCIVDENIGFTEVLFNGLCQAGDRGPVRDVADVPPALLLCRHERECRINSRLRSADHRQSAAIVGQLHCNCLSYATAATGNDCDFATEIMQVVFP